MRMSSDPIPHPSAAVSRGQDLPLIPLPKMVDTSSTAASYRVRTVGVLNQPPPSCPMSPLSGA